MSDPEVNTYSLIQAVERYPLLWDLTSHEYKNLRRKEQAWKQIGTELGISDELCKKKWKGLRSSYSRELGKRSRSGRGARDTKEEIDPSWKYGTQMDFLREHVKGRCTLMNQINHSENTCAPSPTRNFENMFSENPISPQSDFTEGRANVSAQIHRMDESLQQSFLSTLKNALQPLQAASVEPDEDDLFCRSIIKQIKRFPTKEKNRCKLQILSFVAEVENSLIDAGEGDEIKCEATVD